jgi:Cu+-exporting ATPase
MGAAAMSMSSVCVCLNALRLRFFKPEALLKISEKPAETISEDFKEEKIMEKTLKIEGMMCMHCQKHVTEALSKMDGVTEVNVDLEAKTAVVKAGRDIPQAEFKAVIEEAGYELVG